MRQATPRGGLVNTKIAIVEDEGLIALDLQRRLEQAGYAVLSVHDNAEEALAAIEDSRPDLVLMDIRIRGPYDGIEAAGEIRRRFQIPVLFVTAHSDRDTLDRAKLSEPFGYIVKPFAGVDFRAQIEVALWKNRMERKLRESEAWLSATFRSVPDGLIATDSEGQVAFVNAPAEKLTGWTANEAKGRPLMDVFQVFEAETGMPVVHPIEAAFDGREPEPGPRQYLLRSASGETALVETTVSVNRDEGELLGIVLVFRDITERRRNQDREQQLKRMKTLSALSVGVGRELAESQRRIDDSLMQLVAITQGQTLRLVGDIYKRVARQQSIVQQLLSLGSLQPGEAALVNVNVMIAGLKARLKETLGDAIELNLAPEADVSTIQADPMGLAESLNRLMEGARKAMPEGGRVTIATHLLNRKETGGEKDLVRIEVHDTGRSIRPAAREHVFEPYFQARPGGANPGFSLALVHRFVALSGGSIAVESGPGPGTRYVLDFPANAGQDFRGRDVAERDLFGGEFEIRRAS